MTSPFLEVKDMLSKLMKEIRPFYSDVNDDYPYFITSSFQRERLNFIIREGEELLNRFNQEEFHEES